MLQYSLLYLQNLSSVLCMWHSFSYAIIQQPQVYSPLGANGLNLHSCAYVASYLDHFLPYSLSTLQ